MERRKYLEGIKYNNEVPFPPWGENERGVRSQIEETKKIVGNMRPPSQPSPRGEGVFK